ncbi:helix-turn-helix domain-containing protein [Bacillus sonorensis]|uniref:HTH-type transcriptional regulator n=2 Tax=Bacillus sonorensis TaxID=119858 RepID=M5PCW6_9BACI|nr:MULTISPECIES: helix-turn-helix domain-containing protein [Bacillus]TWK79541.1 putative HTH-type transcriptional regulator YybR [Bacillus paralicheniformis]ASB87256.1 putative HTH-type transcriptional regulator YvaP [Bacillus sonorensis]EME73262.1 HTH-type transcriptional regulator [Bacillus sonorensis L12]MBG9914255.1 HxlR family transcriptional regulator [Bacillus sonorensis]MCF7616503.1 helix-turn-helix transcriptional regulator [Bacillus sonorensis]
MNSAVQHKECSALIHDVLKILSGKWSFLVLAELIRGKRRFNELRRNLGNVNTKGLTDTLRHLEENGMISRQVFPTVPVTVEYALTEKGKAFHSIFKEMAMWGEKWMDERE